MYINLHIYNSNSEIRKVNLKDLSKNMKISDLQNKIEEEYGVVVSLQKLIHKGKIMSGVNDETLLHYNVNYNETIQVHTRVVLQDLPATQASEEAKGSVEPEKEKVFEDTLSSLYKTGDPVDVKDCDEGSDTIGAFFEARIKRITKSLNAEEGSDGMNYHVVYDKWAQDDTDYRVSNLKLRPRARTLLSLKDLKVDQEILVNYNVRDGEKIGEWYVGRVTAHDPKKKVLICTVYIGVEATPLPDARIAWTDQIFKQEDPIPPSARDTNIQKELDRVVERKHTIECNKCQDVHTKKCKECGCNKCGKKNNPESLIICDECQLNFHLNCIGLETVPEDEDFYCSNCKRVDNTIRPGDALINKKLKNAPSQTKAQKRDWGRGFACAGRSSINDKVPMSHKGNIPGTEVGMTWFRRIQLSENGVHRPPVAGIHANEKLGAMSIVLNGGYEDDVDNGDEFLYTGSGGRDFDGNKRTNKQSFDQELTKGNRGLAMNCRATVNATEGAEAKDWRQGIPVRVVRGPKLKKHFPKYAPEDGFRYDGLYKVVKYYKEKGMSGFYVWKFVLRRDDSTPAPWTKVGQQKKKERGWSVIYPEGYVPAPPKEKGGKRKGCEGKENSAPPAKKIKFSISDTVKKLAKKDKHNDKVWKELLRREFSSQEEFQESIRTGFSCSICLTLVTEPRKLDCRHNMCKECLARFNKKDVTKVCPLCRAPIKGCEGENKELREALNSIFPGYEAS